MGNTLDAATATAGGVEAMTDFLGKIIGLTAVVLIFSIMITAIRGETAKTTEIKIECVRQHLSGEQCEAIINVR